MFSRFTTPDGEALYVRTVDVRRLEDLPDRCCLVCWNEDGDAQSRVVAGTAQENFERLKQEELAMLMEAQKYEQRQQNNLPILPVPRGRVR